MRNIKIVQYMRERSMKIQGRKTGERETGNKCMTIIGEMGLVATMPVPTIKDFRTMEAEGKAR